MKKHTIDELNKLYNDGESCDSAHFSEQRTNTLLFIGEHYKKLASKFLDRNQSKVTEGTKLKLQENHIQKVANRYISNIVNQAPGCTAVAANENELSDQKDAELSLAVMKHDEETQNFEEKVDRWANSYVVSGEVCAFTYWNPNKGAFKGYSQAVSEAGEPLFIGPNGLKTPSPVDEMGNPLNPAPDEGKPVFQGELCTDVVQGYNVIRHASAELMDESPFICIRKMSTIDEAKSLIAEDDPDRKDKIKHITDLNQTTYRIFDGSKSDYHDSKDQVLLRYFFFRPCVNYPNGYFYLTTEKGIISDSELPFGVFPIAFSGFRECPTSPRFKSLIRDIRHPQLELNRLISQSAYHSIALGDDKIITQMGSKLQKGSTWSGIREFQVNGQAPTVLPGRAGDQFEASIARQVNTIYSLADLEYEAKNAPQGQDVQAMLYGKLSQKAKFSPHARKFERFLSQVWKTRLELSKNYLSDDAVIQAVGKREAINIAEFRKASGYSIKVKPSNTDIDTQMGKSLYIQQVMQYMGKDIPDSMKGQLVRMMPFLNDKQLTSELTITDENIDSDILALDRGEYRPANPSDKHDVYIRRFEHRRKQNDFRLLPPQVQQMYERKIQEHQQFAAQQAQEIQEAQAGFIPAEGPTVKVDFNGPDGKRMQVPFSSLQWLIKRLEQQGLGQQELSQLTEFNQSEILKQLTGISPTETQQMSQMPPMMA